MQPGLIALGGLFLFMGVLHFAVPKPFVSIIPRYLPRAWALPLVYISGVAELAGGAGVLIQPVRFAAGIGLLLLLAAVYPANIQMLVSAIKSKRASTFSLAMLWARMPMQFVLAWWVWVETLKAP